MDAGYLALLATILLCGLVVVAVCLIADAHAPVRVEFKRRGRRW